MKHEKYSQNIYVYQLKCLIDWNLNKEKLSGTYFHVRFDRFTF